MHSLRENLPDQGGLAGLDPHKVLIKGGFYAMERGEGPRCLVIWT